MKLTLNGKEYQSPVLTLFTISIGEARAIKRHTGLTIADWHDGLKTLGRFDPDVCLSLVFLLKSRAGESVNWDELNALSAMDVVAAFDFTLTDDDRSDMARSVVAEAEQALDEAPGATE